MRGLPAVIVAALLLVTGAALLFVGLSLHNNSFQWRQVRIAGRTQCLPVASSVGAKQRGLQGVKRVVRPMVFPYSPPDMPSFWMEDTPTALTGVWVGGSGRVIGYWHGQPNSDDLQYPPAAVSAVIEYRYGAQVPRVGAKYALGGSCRASDGGL